MFYEVYIDIFFAVNAMLDFLVILIVQKIQHYRSTKIRIAAASMTGSAVLSLYLCIPARHYMWVRLVFYILAYTGMALIAFPGNRKTERLYAVIALYLVSFLVNGVVQWLDLDVEHILGLFVLCVFIYLGLKGTYVLCAQKKKEEQHIYEIRIIYKKQPIDLRGLWDTGNRLRSPYHRKGVSVVSYESIRDYLSIPVRQCVESGDFMQMQNIEERVFLIPYETVGTDAGLMPVVEAEKMFIKKEEEELEYENPLLGISSKPVSSSDAFQAVLTIQG